METAGRVVALGLLVVLASTAGLAVQDGPVGQTAIDADTTILAADVAPDGDAQWRVTYRIRLETDNETAAFANLREDIRQNTSEYLGPFRNRIEMTVADAENATGRVMRARNFSVSVTTDPQPQVTYGIVTYRFEWLGFAATEGDTLRVGDAVDQFILESGTVLQFSWPENYGIRRIVPSEPATVEGNTVEWRGPIDFDPGEPRAVVVEGLTPTATPTQDGGDGTGGDGTGGADGGVPVVPLAVVAALLLGAGAWLYVRGDGEVPLDVEAGEDAGAGETGADDGPPEELLSNEERVLRLLEDNGGRMKQKEVAEQLDWTAAKTSQVVGDLREDDELESFRLGRENVLTLPDVDIEGGEAGGEDEGT